MLSTLLPKFFIFELSTNFTMRYFTIVFLLLSLSGHTQDSDQYISVDQNTYTVEQLVKDVLINNQCATITNIVSSTGTNFGTPLLLTTFDVTNYSSTDSYSSYLICPSFLVCWLCLLFF